MKPLFPENYSHTYLPFLFSFEDSIDVYRDADGVDYRLVSRYQRNSMHVGSGYLSYNSGYSKDGEPLPYASETCRCVIPPDQLQRLKDYIGAYHNLLS